VLSKREKEIPTENVLQVDRKWVNQDLFQVVVPRAGTLEVQVEKCMGYFNIYTKKDGDVALLGVDIQNPEDSSSEPKKDTQNEQVVFSKFNSFDKNFVVDYNKPGTFLIDIGIPKLAAADLESGEIDEYNEMNESHYVIRTRFSKTGKNKHIWPESFFFKNPYKPEYVDFTHEISRNYVTVTAKKPLPFEGLESYVKNISSAEIVFKVYLVKASIGDLNPIIK
jgi:hypothetical protein